MFQFLLTIAFLGLQLVNAAPGSYGGQKRRRRRATSHQRRLNDDYYVQKSTKAPTRSPSRSPTTAFPTSSPTTSPTTATPTKTPTSGPSASPTIECKVTLENIRAELEILPRGTIGSGDVVNSYNPIVDDQDVFIFSGDNCYVRFCEEGTTDCPNLDRRELQSSHDHKDKDERDLKKYSYYYYPSSSPTKSPTPAPSTSPTVSPTTSPTTSPTFAPTGSPSASPSIAPPLTIALRKGTIIALVQDMDCGVGDGPILQGDLTFDCQGHTVEGSGALGFSSIIGADVRHCEVQGFGVCIGIDPMEPGCTNPVVENTLVTKCMHGIVNKDMSDTNIPTILDKVFAIDNIKVGAKIKTPLPDMDLVTCNNAHYDFLLSDFLNTTGPVICDTGLGCLADFGLNYTISSCDSANYCSNPSHVW